MSKMKNAPETVSAPVSSIVVPEIDLSLGSKAKLVRTWYQAKEEYPQREPLWVLPLRRSADVRSLFPATLPGQEVTPLFVWALMLMRPVHAADAVLWERDEQASGAAGDVVFFFEPAALRDFLAANARASKPVGIHALGKKLVPSKRQGGRKVAAWQWEAFEYPHSVKAPIAAHQILMPTPEEAYPALPAAAPEDSAE